MSEDLIERTIAMWRKTIIETPRFLASRGAANDANGLLMNYGMWAESHIGIGILAWRRGEDPRPEFTAALDAIEQGLAEAVERKAELDDIHQLRLNLAQPIAYLMDRTLPLPAGRTPRADELPDGVADYLLAEALFDRPYRDPLPGVMQALGSKKRQMLSHLSFQTYFGLLDAVGDPVRIAELAAQGDALYLRRKKDVFFSHGSLLSAGGWNNDIMVDYQLSAVLKKVGFDGDSLHRWRWD